ncbi:SusD/RagB family nutrient-binding outer membrane lipoprotein [Terrimonas alba]|uniref:SusD/RagB family nutrient-binding outer membrane lipoprotein n=1 Tax=Terrimonas alba TaxID=3349636 RepID=UPI0035F4D1BC
MFKKIIYIALLPVLIFSNTGCKKGYLDVNQSNPNQTDNPPINALLANVTYQTGLNVYRAGDFTSYYMQYLASPSASGGSDTYDDVDRPGIWQSVYDIIQDSRVMKSLAEEKNAYQHIGVAAITEAMNMSLLIDLFGDVPYSQALDKNILKPSYDKAEDVYAECLKLIDEGITQLNKADPGIVIDPSNDLIHSGVVSAWIKTANALKARLLNRVSKTAAYNPANILAALSSAYTSNSDDAQLKTFVARSPWNQAAYNNTVNLLDGWLSEQFVNALNGDTYGVVDPRLSRIATLTKFNDYRGTVNGAGRIGTGTDDEESYLSVDGFYSKSGAPLLLLTYAEMKFIEAEAKFATDKDGSYQAYLDGIAANMDKIGVPAAEKNAYLTNPAVAVGAAAFTKDLLFKEKYVAMFLNPESWTDARRYDYKYKDFTLPVNAVLSTFVRRVGYPSTEEARNGENVPAVSGLDQKLWWDQ